VKQWLLPKSSLPKLADTIRQTHRLYAPVRLPDQVAFGEIGEGDPFTLDYANARTSVKTLFFPQAETMLRYERSLDRYNDISATPVDSVPTVVLGMRPCDARGLELLDRVFGQGQYHDPYYLARRQATVVVALACAAPRQTCFCHAVGGDPYSGDGGDVLLSESDEAYVAVAQTTKGQEWLASLGLSEADAGHLATAETIAEAAHEKLVKMAPAAGLEDKLTALFESEVWGEIAEKCIACGTCTYLCPGCHCFNIQDRVLANGGIRLRSWDGCMYEGFTVHTSGHNPRPDQGARWRQRVLHKFAYLPENVGMYGCVGCGRCITYCPVRLDIREVIARLRIETAAQLQGEQ